MMKNNWPEILKKEMEDRQLNQKELSTLIGVDVHTFNRWINGHTTPSILWQTQLKRILKTSIA